MTISIDTRIEELERLMPWLRPDVVASLCQLFFRDDYRRLPSSLDGSLSREHFAFYTVGKRRLSSLCGRDAPPELYGQRDYDLGVQCLLAFLGL